jgi:Tfp pilus assembly protein PilV
MKPLWLIPAAMWNNKKSGMMMIEVLLALSIVVLVLVALTAAATVSIRNTTFAKNTVLANSYVQQGIEKAREARDRADNWDEFITNFSGDKGLDSDLNWNGCGSANVGIFTRCLNFNNSLADKSLVRVNVSWSESGRNHSSEASVILSKWSD